MREEEMRRNEEIARKIDEKRAKQLNEKSPYMSQPPVPPTPPVNNTMNDYMETPKPNNTQGYIELLSQPQMNQPFDVIPLPSEGKLYPSRKKNVKVAYLTTADENILTSPNLIESGDFLEILINRKLLEPELRYKDLLPGDRDAIMIWLRATGYGEIYPIMAYNKDGEEFETDVNLSELNIINLNIEPDSDGLFSFNLPLSKKTIRFKMLTVGEIDELEEIAETNKDNPVNEAKTLILESQIVEIDGRKDKAYIKEFVSSMRIMDAKKLREYMEKIECGVDMNITIKAPGGESIATFLPITPRFFWPDFAI
jgi:hypothetical protein